MYAGAHSGTWLRGRLWQSCELRLGITEVAARYPYFLPNFMLTGSALARALCCILIGGDTLSGGVSVAEQVERGPGGRRVQILEVEWREDMTMPLDIIISGGMDGARGVWPGLSELHTDGTSQELPQGRGSTSEE